MRVVREIIRELPLLAFIIGVFWFFIAVFSGIKDSSACKELGGIYFKDDCYVDHKPIGESNGR